MDITLQIRSELDGMTRSERQVGLFCLAHMSDIVFFTLAELARHSDVSTTSVLRFCRRLNFEGFKDFQQEVRTQLKHRPDLPEKFRRAAEELPEDSLLVQTIQQGILCIRQTFQELSSDAIRNAVSRIASARRVFTFGMRESQALASYAYSRLLTVRGDVFLYQEGCSGNVESLLSLTAEDVVLVYLFHRYTRQTIHILELMKRQGLQIILVTSPPVEAVAQLATVLLPCRVDAKGIKNSALAPICLADYLCNAVSMIHPEHTLQRMQQSEELFRFSETLSN